MPKYVRRKRTYKKRYTRKRSIYKKKTTPLMKKSRILKLACRNIIEVSDNGASNSQTFCFARFQPGGIVSAVNGFNNTDSWDKNYKNWEQYAVTGFSMKWIPTNLVGQLNPDNPSRVGAQITSTVLWDDINTYDTSGFTAAQIIQQDSSKFLTPGRTLQIFRNNKPLAKNMQAKWQNTEGFSSLVYNELPKASCAMRITYNGFGSSLAPDIPVIIGYIRYTYYVTFRGQKKS